MLNDEQIKEIKSKIENAIFDFDDEDYENMESANYDGNPFGVEGHLIGSSGCWVADEDEEWSVAAQKTLDAFEDDPCMFSFVDPDEDDYEDVCSDVREFLENEMGS